MASKKSMVLEQLEQVLSEIGGYTIKDAEIWAGFCTAVGMDPLPYLRVMLNNVCDVKLAYNERDVPSRANSPQLWIVCKAFRSYFKLVEPPDSGKCQRSEFGI